MEADTIAKILVDPVTLTIVTTALFGLSEALSLIPSVKANGVFQLIVNVLKKVSGKQ